MENNCLYKNLKGSVSADLPKYGEFKFSVDVNSNILAPFWIESANPVTCTITGEGHFYRGTLQEPTDITTTISNVYTTAGYRISAGKSTISIISKYGITNISLGTGDSIMSDADINLSALENNETPINKLQLAFTGIADLLPVYVDVDKINLSNLSTIYLCNIHAKGDIKNIAKALVLEQDGFCTIGLAGAYQMQELTGSIEEFVRNLKPASYGMTGIFLQANNYYFNGESLGYTTIIDTAANGDATITRTVDSVIIATYNRQSDIFTYTTL